MAGGLNPKIEADKIYYQYFTDVMDLHFRTLNQSQPFARVSTFIFYATGFIVLAVPSVEVFWRVGVVAIKGVGDA